MQITVNNMLFVDMIGANHAYEIVILFRKKYAQIVTFGELIDSPEMLVIPSVQDVLSV